FGFAREKHRSPTIEARPRLPRQAFKPMSSAAPRAVDQSLALLNHFDIVDDVLIDHLDLLDNVLGVNGGTAHRHSRKRPARTPDPTALTACGDDDPLTAGRAA